MLKITEFLFLDRKYVREIREFADESDLFNASSWELFCFIENVSFFSSVRTMTSRFLGGTYLVGDF